MNRLMSATQSVYRHLLTLLNALAVILIFFIAVWICVDVVGRSGFNHPIPGTPELVKSLLAAIVFLAFAYTLRQGRHVNAEVITKRLPPLGREMVTLVGSLGGMVIFAIVTWYSWDEAWAGWLIREYEGVQLKVPIYPVRFIVVLGAGLLSFQFFLNMLVSIGALFGWRKGAR